MAHHRREGSFVGHGATVREINALSTLFDEVRHVAFLYPGPGPRSALPYSSDSIELVPLPPAGGKSLLEKAKVASRLPLYARVVERELRRADVVHVRAPASVSAWAAIRLAISRASKPVWIKYAGSWDGYEGEPGTYAAQRWILRRHPRATVTVNGEWPEQPDHVATFINPCLSAEELGAGRKALQEKPPLRPLRIIFVGALRFAKGVDKLVDIIRILEERGLSLHVDVVGDGPQKSLIEKRIRTIGPGATVVVHGALPRPEIGDLYADAHINLLPSKAEGWPKVLSEGMAYGAVPVASAVGSIAGYLSKYRTGVAVQPSDIEGFVSAVESYAADQDRWRLHAERAVRAAENFSYAAYLRAVEQQVLGAAQC